MKKRIATLICIVFIFTIFTFSVNAEATDDGKLPFMLSAPQNTDLTWLSGQDSPTSMLCSYEMSDDMSSFFSRDDKSQQELFEKFKMKDAEIIAQIDWSIDRNDDWHYTNYWNGSESYSGYDSNGNYRLGIWDEIRGQAKPDGFSSTTIMRGNILTNDKNAAADSNKWWDGTGLTPGLKNQIPTGTCSFIPISKTESQMKIDYSAHTVYIRVRWDISYRGENDTGILSRSHYYSDWSETAAYGKDAPAFEPFTTDNLPSPEPENITIKNGEKPEAHFEMELSDEFKIRLNKLFVAGGKAGLDVKVKLKGTSAWTDIPCSLSLNDTQVSVPLDDLTENGSISSDDEIILCCRYHIEQYSYPDGKYTGDVNSLYCEMITVRADAQNAEVSYAELHTDDNIDNNQHTCPVCGICPVQPLGLCLFIWAAIVLAVLIIIVSAVIKEKISRKNP